MRTAEIELGGRYLVSLPYNGGGGIAEVVETGVSGPEMLIGLRRGYVDLPYNGHGQPSVVIRWDGPPNHGKTQAVHSRDVIRPAS